MTRVTIKRSLTGDRGPPGVQEMTVDILTAEQIGPKMSRMANGSLLCRDVPIARVGWMVYGANETPITPGSTGMAYVERTADELFSPETMGSFMAAPVVDEHPFVSEHPDGVVPANWSRLSRGFATTNVRRGKGADADVLLADLVITDKDLIEQVLAGKREVSCGYDADYEQTGPGLGRQTKILGNHIALVRKGRCGPRCAIGDRASPSTEKETSMTKRVPLKTTRRAVIDSATLDAARQRAADAQAELEELEQEGDDDDESGATHIHIHTADEDDPAAVRARTDDRLAIIETGLSTLTATVQQLVAAVGGSGETAEEKVAREAAEAIAAKLTTDAEGNGDSKALATSYANVLAQAEVLVPGFRMPTFDAALKRSQTVDSMCAARRRCLDIAYATRDGQELIDSIGDTKDLDLAKMDCAATAVLFTAASGAKKLLNNRAATKDGATTPPAKKEERTGPMTNAERNKANTEFWAKQETAGA